MLCQECGTNNPETNNFCGNCGRRLFAKPVREIPVREPIAANQGRVRSTGDALSRLGIADYDYVDVSEHAAVEPAEPRVTAEPVPIRTSPLSIAPPAEPVSAPEPPARVVEPEPLAEEEEPVHISGPSFLGLTDSTSSDQSEYLLQDEAPRGRGGLVLLILLLAAIGVAAWLEWPKIKSGEIHIPYLDKLISQTNSGAAPNQKAVDQADGSDEKLTTNDPTLKDQNLDTKTADSKAAENNSATANAPDAGAASAASTTGAAAAADAATSAKTPETKQPAEAKPASTSDSTDGDATAAEAAAPSKPTPAAKTKPSARGAKAEGGPDPSQNTNLLMGEKYLYGRGAPQNCNQAINYFKAAANEENVPAMSHLGAMYASGNCVTMNRVTAYTWLAKAQNSDPGNHWRERNMNMLWRDMTPQERAAVSR